MGKRAERKAFKKNGVDAAMSVADAEPTSGGGGGGWSYGDQISAMAEDGKDGADVSAAAAKKPSSGGALTAGGAHAQENAHRLEVSPSERTRLSPRPSRTPTAGRTRRRRRRPDAASARRERGSTDDPFPTKGGFARDR